MTSIEQLEHKNDILTALLQQVRSSETTPYVNSANKISFSNILQELIKNAERNHHKYPTHRKHSEIIKRFATALFLFAGPLSYEFIHQNIPQGLPCLRTIQAAIYSEYQVIDEGVFRFDQLKEHINRYKAPPFVSIGEDATRVVGRVEYDCATDRCVGFVLPLNNDGLPVVDAFVAVSFPAMENMFRKVSVAKYAYVYMAQPLWQNVPPFCLACFGTDNKFCAEDLLPRWTYITDECSKRGITVLSFGADGDSRLMKCMKISSSFLPSSYSLPTNYISPSIPTTWENWFHIQPINIAYVQDTVHLAVKLKSRLLKPNIALRMGDYTATGSHIYALTTKFQKDEHGLRLRDINHKDKQNFKAVENITAASHLLSGVPESDATKCYVELIKYVTDTFLDQQLDPLKRIEDLWYVAFFMRFWRKWLTLNKSCNLRDNFITPNAYMCIELNAHALIVFLMTIRDHVKDSKCFLPWLLGSQSCEATFRAARSMSSIFSTMINFGMLGLLRRLHRLHIQLALQANSDEDMVFPRVAKHQRKAQRLSHNLDFTNDDIYKAISKAKDKAKLMVEKLGMAELFERHSLWGSDKTIVGIDGGKEKDLRDVGEEDDDSDGEDDDVNGNREEEETIDECGNEESMHISDDIGAFIENGCIDSALQENLEQKKKRLAFQRLPSSTISMYQCVEVQSDKQKKSPRAGQNKFNPFVEVLTHTQKTILIRKTTALWLLQEGERLSSDRIFRVRSRQPYSESLPGAKMVKPFILADNDIVKLKTKDVVVVDYEGEDEDCNASKAWLKIKGICLYDSDRRILSDGKWLYGTHLSAVQYFLKERFPKVNGLEDTALVLKNNHRLLPGSVQVLHVNGNHWLTVSTLDSGVDVTIYDSLHFTLSEDTKAQLAKLLKSQKKAITVKFASTNKQAGGDDCGVFAAAYSTSLVYGQDPSGYVYNQKMMRKHLIKCFDERMIQPFPVIRTRRAGSSSLINIRVHCYCRYIDDGAPMVQCNICKEWFHFNCITTQVQKMKKWYCKNCVVDNN